jgi:hypothetical protein
MRETIDAQTFDHGDFRAPRFLTRVEQFTLDHLKALSITIAGLLTVFAGVSYHHDTRTLPIEMGKADHMIVGSLGPITTAQTEWRAIPRAPEVLSLEAVHLRGLPRSHSARRSPEGLREDALVIGDPLSEAGHTKIVLSRGTLPEAPLFVELARRLAEQGLAIVRDTAPSPLTTKFGPIEAAELAVSAPNGREGRQTDVPCVAFRHRTAAGIGLIGWSCMRKSEALTRPQIACLIDRITLLSAGENGPLRQEFAAAERRRLNCPGTRNTAGRRATWLDVDGAVPGLRGTNVTPATRS